jgi:murein tripeptide amidase MpaA
MRRILPLLALIAFAAAPSAQAKEQRLSVKITDASVQIPLMERLGVDVTHDVHRYSADVVVHSLAEKEALQDHGFTWKVEEPDLEALARRNRAADRAYSARVAASPLPSGRTEYRVYEDYLREIDEIVAQHPSLARKVTLPKKSVLGEPIVGVEISKDVSRTDDGKPVYVVMGLHHAREWPSAEVNMEFALDLVRSFGNDERVTRLLERERVVVIPVINPDGFRISRGNVASSPQFRGTANAGASKRKNCAVNTPAEAGQPCQNRSGVDLNRNYAAYWGGNGASSVFPADDYRGPGPWSEPETQAVHEFSQRLQITNFQTIHNIAALVLRPPGFRAQGLAPDEERLKALGDAMGEATGYSSEYGFQLYEVTGATEDWNYVAQGAFGYTIELGGQNGFQGPYQTNVVNQYVGAGEQAGRGVRDALLLAGEQAANPVDHSILKGDAPPGITLKLRKDFKTVTSPVCPVDVGIADNLTGQVSTAAGAPYVSSCPIGLETREIDDFLETTTVVPPDGQFTWHVNPSTRPFEAKNGRVEAWTLSCEAAGVQLHKRQIVVSRGETLDFNGLCGGGPARSSRTPVDPAFAAFETRLATTQRTAAAASRAAAARGVRLTLGRVLTTRERTVRKNRSIRIGVRLRGATLQNTSFVLRSGDRQIIAQTMRRRLKAGRSIIRIRLPRGLKRGRYRLTAKGFTTQERAPIGAAARLIVRR